MSGTLTSLQRKIDSANDLRSVVRTMKAVSASNLGQYEKSVSGLADYYRSVELGLGACFRESSNEVPFMGRKKSPGRIIALVFGSDQGLVGQFNTTISTFVNKTLAQLPGKSEVWAVGERVRERLSGSANPSTVFFNLPVSIKGIVPLIGEILLEREKQQNWNENVGISLFYNRPKVAEVYSPIVQRLLPLDQRWLEKLKEQPWPEGRYSQILGDNSQTLRAFIHEYLFISLFRACAESLASENASRLAAMERADQNIDDMVSDLKGNFHRLRKEGIDEELFDVIAAFDTLQGDSRISS